MCGGGGGGASPEQVDASVKAGVDDAKGYIDSTVGLASPTGTTEVGGGTFTTPVVNSIGADGKIVQSGGETVSYGGGTADVTGTVKGDTEKLIGGQAETKDLINQRFDTFTPTTVVNQTVDTSGIENRIGSLEGVTNTGFATSAENQGKLLQDTGNLLVDVRDLGTDIDTGFASANAGIGELKTGQSGLATGISDLSGKVSDRFDKVDGTLDTGFAGVNSNINTQFDAQNQNLTDMSANILGGQTNLQSYLEGMSNRADTYYGGLSEGQANIMGGIGGLQTGLGDFRDTYDTNTTLANQTRAELLDTVTGGFNNTREAIADNFGNTQKEIAGVSGQIADQGRVEQSGQEDFTQTVRELAAGLDAGNRDQAAAQQDVLTRLDTVRQVLATQGDNLPEDLARQYTQLATSFDQNGRLIRESVDQQGQITRRAMDNQSNVLLAQFDNQGTMIGQSMFNMNSLLKQMDQLGYTGRGQQPGELAPQQLVNRRAAIDSGLMQRQDPYFNTFG